MPYAYKSSFGVTYYLNRRTKTALRGKQRTAYFFTLDPRPDEGIEQVPAGYAITEKQKTGTPYLKPINGRSRS